MAVDTGAVLTPDELAEMGYAAPERRDKPAAGRVAWRRPGQTATVVVRVPCRPGQEHEVAERIRDLLLPCGMRPKFERG